MRIQNIALTFILGAWCSWSAAAELNRPLIYNPVNQTFWNQWQEARSSAVPEKALEFAHRQFLKAQKDALLRDEAALAFAKSLKDLGMPQLAIYGLAELIERRAASQLGQAALQEVREIAESTTTDRDWIESFFITNDVGPLHSTNQNMVSTFRYLYNLRYGYFDWAKNERKRIEPNSYWDYELRYWDSIGDLAREKASLAREKLEKLAQDTVAPEGIRNRARWQMARFYFADGRYEEVDAELRQIEALPLREKGRIHLERAWALFYLKKPDQSLGLLTALKAPYFLSSVTPERFVLETVIYRDLCLYDSAAASIKNYKNLFASSLASIRARKDLRTDPMLANLTLMNLDFQPRANLIDQLRRESASLKQQHLTKSELVQRALNLANHRIATLKRALDLEVRSAVRQTADQLLKVDEQIQYLDYISRLDRLRLMRSNEDRDFQSPAISYLTFDSIYWPVQNEFWWDEFSDYRVLLSSKCQQSQLPFDPRKEREFR